MKKILSLAILAALSTPVLAETTVDFAHESNKETTAKAGYALENGISFDVELVGQDNFKNLKETTIGAAWKFDLSDNLYVQPQVDFTMPMHDNSQSGSLRIEEKGVDETIKGKLEMGNTAKFGLKTGYNFDNGLYISGRYRYEMTTDTAKLTGSDNNNKPNGKSVKAEFENNVHRTDATFGYSMEIVDISANWVHKELKTKVSAKGYVGKQSEKVSARIDYYEFKATVNAFGDIKPYVQYTLDQTEVAFGKHDNLFKVGVNYTF